MPLSLQPDKKMFGVTLALCLIGAAGDVIRQAGLDLMVVDFHDSHQAPDQLAPTVARAIRAASKMGLG